MPFNLTTCTVTGNISRPDGTPLYPATISFIMTRRDRDGDIVIMPDPVSATIDQNGEFTIELWPNAAGYAGTQYNVEIKEVPVSGLATTFARFKATVPETASADLAAIMELSPPTSVDDAEAAAQAAQQALAEIVIIEATIAGYVTTVQPILDNMGAVITVANGISDISAVAAISSSVVIVAGIASAVSAVAAISSSVTTVAANMAAVQSVATNMTAILNAEANANTATIQAGIATTQAQAATDAMTLAQTAANGAAATKTQVDATYQQMLTALGNVTDYSNTLGQLSPAAVDVVTAADVVDFFIYDTTLDSDGGAWRKRTNWTSWFKETLNTATRGARNQFPSKALLVLRNNSTTLAIYDLDQASCPLWMSFTGTYSFASGNMLTAIYSGSAVAIPTSVVAINGQIIVGSNGTTPQGIAIIDLVADRGYSRNSTSTYTYNGSVSQRNAGLGAASVAGGLSGSSPSINDITVAVTPGTPIDKQRRLPTPTVAVATAGGVSVVHWDGRVASSADTNQKVAVAFDRDGTLWAARSGNSGMYFSPPAAYAVTAFPTTYYSAASVPTLIGQGSMIASCGDAGMAFGNSSGLNKLRHRPVTGYATNAQNNASAVAYVTSKFNTGYMHGDVKCALSESTSDLTSLVQGSSSFDAGQNFVTGPGADQDTGTGVSNDDGTTITLVGTDGSNRGRRSYDLTGLNAGGTYTISGVLAVNSGTLSINIGNAVGNSNTLAQTVAASGAFSFTFAPGATTRTVTLQTHSTGGDLSITQLKVRERITTVLYDDFGQYPDKASLLAAGWTETAGGQLSVSAGEVTLTRTAAASERGTLAVSGFTVGQTYQLEVDITSISSSNGILSIAASGPQGTTIADISIAAPANNQRLTFVATATTMYVVMRRTANGTTTYSRIRIDRVANDRSVNTIYPVVYGVVTRVAVASGSEMAAFSNFTNSNFLDTPYSSGLDFGTGDFWAAAVVNTSTVGSFETIFSYGSRSSTAGWSLMLTNTGFRIYYTNTSGTNVVVSYTATLSTWLHVIFARRAGVFEVWVNGVLIGTTTTGAATNLSNVGGTLQIGNDFNTFGSSDYWRGSIAIPRVGAGAPTPQQIRDMAAAEMPLFQSNAKCLLPADSVSDISYDDSTDLLHVATTGGMARLKDLLVVDKDSIVVAGVEARSGNVVTRGGAAGQEVAVNGGFTTDTDWTKGTGVTITGGNLIFTAAASAQGAVANVPPLTPGKLYQAEVVISSYTAGNLLARFGANASANQSLAVTGPGTYRVTGVAEDAAFSLRGSGTTTMSVDSVSVKPYGVGLQAPSILIREELLNKGVQTPYDRDRIKGSGVTTNATSTVIGRLPMDKGETGNWTVRAKANQYADGPAYAAYVRWFDSYRPEEGNIALRGSVQALGTDIESTGTMDLTIVANTTTQTFDITAVGIAATNLNWEWDAWRT